MGDGPSGREDDRGALAGGARGDVGVGLALLVGSAAVLALAYQRWLAGDGPHLLDTFLFEDELWMHVLYLPVARALDSVFEPVLALEAVSVVGGAIGTAATYALARGLGASRARAAIAGGLALATPAVWFFATTIEVHALHLAAVAVAAAAVVLAPVRPAWMPIAVACAGAPLVYLTHKSGILLAPGLVALAALARARRGAPAFTRGELVLALAAVGGAFLGSVALGAWLVPANSVGATLEFLERYQRFQPWLFVRDGVLGGLGMLLPLAVVGWTRSPRAERLAGAVFVLPVALFFTWYGEPNRGAYFTAIVPVLAWLAVRAWPDDATRRGTAVLVLCLAAQLALALELERRFDARISVERHERRLAGVRAVLGTEGTLISFRSERQPVTHEIPGVREINLRLELARALGAGTAPEDAAREVLEFVRGYRGRVEGPLAIDLTTPRAGGPFGRTVERLAELAAAELGPAAAEEPRLFVIP